MNIHLAFVDLVRLGKDGKLEKDGVTITFGRPVLSEVTVNAKDDPPKSGKVAFFWMNQKQVDLRRTTHLASRAPEKVGGQAS
jgi:hypothetical protein